MKGCHVSALGRIRKRKSAYVISDNFDMALWVAVFVVPRAHSDWFILELDDHLDMIDVETSVESTFGAKYSYMVVTAEIESLMLGSDESVKDSAKLRKACRDAQRAHRFMHGDCDLFSPARYFAYDPKKAKELLGHLKRSGRG
jgi:hypothetical protein